jgi:hypothetical protein
MSFFTISFASLRASVSVPKTFISIPVIAESWFRINLMLGGSIISGRAVGGMSENEKNHWNDGLDMIISRYVLRNSELFRYIDFNVKKTIFICCLEPTKQEKKNANQTGNREKRENTNLNKLRIA